MIQKPILTEKSLQLAARGQYTFRVSADYSKREIGSAIHDLYNVDVVSVHTISMHGKVRRTGRRMTQKRLPDWKKAIVELKKGQTIDAFHITGEPEEK